MLSFKKYALLGFLFVGFAPVSAASQDGGKFVRCDTYEQLKDDATELKLAVMAITQYINLRKSLQPFELNNYVQASDNKHLKRFHHDAVSENLNDAQLEAMIEMIQSGLEQSGFIG